MIRARRKSSAPVERDRSTSSAKDRRGLPSVLLVTDELQVGGLERVVVDLANGLAGRGHHVGVAAEPTGPLWDELAPAVARHHLPSRAGVPGQAARYAALRRIVRTGEYAVLHPHQRAAALAARLASAGSRTVVVEHVHSTFQPNALGRLLSFRGHLLIACGTQVAEMLVHGFGRRADRVKVVLNGVADPFGGSAAPRAAREGGSLHFLGIGRMSDLKDPLRFLRVIARVRALGREVSATWLGDGELEADMRRFIDAHGLQSSVSLPGVIADTREHFARADLLLSTSRREGLPLIALEALAAGRGVVLPAIGSCGDAVAGGGGMLYDLATEDEELARLLSELTPAQIAAWGARARESFERTFTLDRMVGQVTEVYDEALGRRARRTASV